jgi:colanic acid biosynthesis glycosyl transferase WcaI
MRVLLVSQYFHPEMTAASLRLRPLAAGLAQRGHDVVVICEVPNHPQGIVHPGYARRPIVWRELDGMSAGYVWAYATTSKAARSRLVTYVTYAASATLLGSVLKRPDVIFASSPPLSVGAVGALLAKRYRVPWVLDVRDLWPTAVVALGELSGRFAPRFGTWLERTLYRDADAITTVTEPFVDHVASLSSREKVHLIENGTTRAWLEMGAVDVDRRGLDLPPDCFVWTFAGNVGLSQDLDTALEAAELLGDGYKLLILGDGASRSRLLERAGSLPDGRVEFRHAVPAEEAARFMRASDALLVPLADEPALGQTIPIKLYDSCAVGRPVIIAAPGEARRLASEQGAGLAVTPGDPQALAEAVRSLAADDRLRDEVTRRAVTFAESRLREEQVGPLERVLESVAG